MPTKPIITVTSVTSQANNRYLDTFYDQHRCPQIPKFASGRPFWGYREMAANKGDRDGFIGADLTPGRHVEPGEASHVAWDAGWHAPWMPEGRFFDFDYQRNRINIRYDRIIGERTAIYKKYYAAAAKLTFEKNQEIVYGALPIYAVRVIIGEPPESPKVAQAAQAGDRWILGFTDEVNEELALLLGLSVRGLVLAKPEREPFATPDAVLGSSSQALQAMIAEAVAQALAVRDTEAAAKKEKDRAKMATVRAKRKPTGTAA